MIVAIVVLIRNVRSSGHLAIEFSSAGKPTNLYLHVAYVLLIFSLKNYELNLNIRMFRDDKI